MESWMSRRTMAGIVFEAFAAWRRFFSAAQTQVKVLIRREIPLSSIAVWLGLCQAVKGIRAANCSSTSPSMRSVLLRVIRAWAKRRTALGLATITSHPPSATMPAPAPRPCNRLLPTLQIQAQKASDSLRHRRRGRGADLRTGSWPQGRSASPPELARLPDAEDTRGGACPARPPPLRRIVEDEKSRAHEIPS